MWSAGGTECRKVTESDGRGGNGGDGGGGRGGRTVLRQKLYVHTVRDKGGGGGRGREKEISMPTQETI